MSSTPVAPYTLTDFDYDLPPERIAKYPLPQRDQSRMLHLNRSLGTMAHYRFDALPELLEPGDLVVFNNARVIPARLHGHRYGHTGRVEIFLMHPENTEKTRWQVLMKPARRLKPGSIIRFPDSPLSATVLDRYESGRGVVELQWPAELSLDGVLEQTGTMPIPPYLERNAETLDMERYQTVFAKVSGAQASPTAGLHFTPEILKQLEDKGVRQAEITLYVSAGTFRPVLSETIAEHRMDPEFYTIPLETVTAIAQAKAQGRRVIAIGTTVAKTLESSAHTHNGTVVAESAWSELFIRPGFRFTIVDAMLTNFHLPKSTLLMLVSAFANRDQILKAYTTAIDEQYRFYSYGDCMLIT